MTGDGRRKREARRKKIEVGSTKKKKENKQ